jgi:hypothetical protein
MKIYAVSMRIENGICQQVIYINQHGGDEN